MVVTNDAIYDQGAADDLHETRGSRRRGIECDDRAEYDADLKDNRYGGGGEVLQREVHEEVTQHLRQKRNDDGPEVAVDWITHNRRLGESDENGCHQGGAEEDEKAVQHRRDQVVQAPADEQVGAETEGAEYGQDASKQGIAAGLNGAQAADADHGHANERHDQAEPKTAGEYDAEDDDLRQDDPHGRGPAQHAGHQDAGVFEGDEKQDEINREPEAGYAREQPMTPGQARQVLAVSRKDKRQQAERNEPEADKDDDEGGNAFALSDADGDRRHACRENHRQDY